LIDRLLGEHDPVVRVVEHYTLDEKGAEYLSVRISVHHANAVVVIREYWQGNSLAAYGYYLRTHGHEEWWDNRPHHPEIHTHPHHRHIGGEAHPSLNPSLEKFLDTVNRLLHLHST